MNESDNHSKPPASSDDAVGNSSTSAVAENHNPSAVLASTSVARTLSVSDQHATIMLTRKDKDERALLKLTIVPFHKTDLARLPRVSEEDGSKASLTEEDLRAKKELREKEEQDHSYKVLNFLHRFDWRCTSESGAEYSYHEAFPRSSSANKEDKEPDAKRAKIEAPDGSNPEEASSFKVELICPASERQIARAMPSPGMVMINETPNDYANIVQPFIDKIVASGSLSWLKNIVEVKKEKERLLYNGDGWILNIDTKWRTHPDALTIPQSKWYQHESVVDLYCLGILKADGVASLRDLSGEHLPVLRDMLKQGTKVIEQVYGVKSEQLRIFVHYQPQFYHFHVHFTRLENDTGCQVEKAHLLLDIIQDLQADPDCFQKRILTYKLSLASELYSLLRDFKQEDEK